MGRLKGILHPLQTHIESHNVNYVTFSFCLLQEAQALDLAAVFPAGGHKIDPGSIDGAMPQNIRQLGNILLQRIESPGE